MHLEESGAYTLTLGAVSLPRPQTATTFGNLPELLGVADTRTQPEQYSFEGGYVNGWAGARCRQGR